MPQVQPKSYLGVIGDLSHKCYQRLHQVLPSGLSLATSPAFRPLRGIETLNLLPPVYGYAGRCQDYEGTGVVIVLSSQFRFKVTTWREDRGTAPHGGGRPRGTAHRTHCLYLGGADYAVAACACLHSAVNQAGSFTARSARILRSSSMPAFFRPLMNLL